MKTLIKLNGLLNSISWLIWIGVVVLNSLGVTKVPWNVAIVPMVCSAVILVGFLFAGLSNKKVMLELIEEQKKNKERK